MTQRMVLDASVAAKWYLTDEDDVDLAEDVLLMLLNDEVEHVPALFT